MASIVSVVGIPDRFAYSMSKGAVLAMTYSVACDYLSDGIRCNAIAPARVHTPFVDGFLAEHYAGREEEMFGRLSKAQPIGKDGAAGGSGRTGRVPVLRRGRLHDGLPSSDRRRNDHVAALRLTPSIPVRCGVHAPPFLVRLRISRWNLRPSIRCGPGLGRAVDLPADRPGQRRCRASCPSRQTRYFAYPARSMKLIRFGRPGEERPGLLLKDGTRVDASAVARGLRRIFFPR